ncbi:MAG: hypothetical protein ACRD3F_02855 [Acidobacteriaceae bacterium]
MIQAHKKQIQQSNELLSLDADPGSWNLKLTALSADQPERLARYLTGALLACGGWVLTRSTQGNEVAELDFEFARASCVEIYAILVAAGLELSRNSHLQLAELCHCTRNLIETRAFDIVRVDLVVYHATSKAGLEEYTSALAG